MEPPYEPALETLLTKWMPPGSGMAPLTLFRVLGRHEELASRARPLGAGILGKGKVPPLLREIMIHRTCALTGAEYEWGVHATGFGRPLGLSEEQLVSTVHGSAEDPMWSPAERAVFALADELHTSSTVSDDLFATLTENFDDEQILELCVTAGWYHAISYVINTARLPLESWAERFPAPGR
ncbi:carboxymuconolactone decarboxylase family protein [Mycolicibacterium vinylchloridicum]|uniref:carboxymuconolactone decarboxylase family protein n=1 Tax=Mycolicibacterium vinylchloridicum TaxID=2736928 RepID=UPI001F4032CE|nr:carboxymuconolactone decarboxylase family protein [Mycolicibacterium vinylchloridicum]